jgi:hypothetical protein
MTKISHVFTNERYYQEIQIRKDCLQNTPPSLDVSQISSYAEPGEVGETAARLQAIPNAFVSPEVSNKSQIKPTDLKGKGGIRITEAVDRTTKPNGVTPYINSKNK